MQPFPIFASREEAEAYSDKTGDSYYELCYWLEGQLNLCVMAMHDAYVEALPGKRAMQSGVVRKMIHREEFKPETLLGILKCCLHYAKEETCHAYSVRAALAALELELGFRKLSFDLANPDPKQTDLVLGWLCDWLESRLHYLAHRAWYACPESFSPDADISQLSDLGFIERHLANLPARDKERFHGLLDRGATRYDRTRLWPQVGKVMHDPQPRTWTHPQVDARRQQNEFEINNLYDKSNTPLRYLHTSDSNWHVAFGRAVQLDVFRPPESAGPAGPRTAKKRRPAIPARQ